jgi:regulator of sigma D
MGLFSKLMGANEVRNTRSLKPLDPSAGIAYDPELVNTLKQDHQELVRIYTAIKAAAAENRFSEIRDLLSDFKLTFQTHIAVENVRFYVYVQQHAALDADTSNFIADVRKEMNSIARAVMKFVDTYMTAPPTPVTVTGFNAELEQIGSVLVQRVQLEESRLYSLYQP